MHDNGVTLQKKVLQNLDIPYSYELAKRMEQYRSHPTLGYRPAGSKAEFETGEMLKTEMEKIGLSEVTKDAVTVDGWEFHKAALSYTNAAGETVSAELGAYQTTFVTDGPKEFSKSNVWISDSTRSSAFQKSGTVRCPKKLTVNRSMSFSLAFSDQQLPQVNVSPLIIYKHLLEVNNPLIGFNYILPILLVA